MTKKQRFQAELDAEVDNLFDDDDLPDDTGQAPAATGASRAAQPLLQSHRADWQEEDMPEELQDDWEEGEDDKDAVENQGGVHASTGRVPFPGK
eukprot:gene200-392_t